MDPKNCKTMPAGNTKTDCVSYLPQVTADQGQLKLILGTFFGLIAAIAIIILVIAAINFATAGSNSEKISRAKRSILYSLIGLTVALSAEVIVLTVIGRL